MTGGKSGLRSSEIDKLKLDSQICSHACRAGEATEFKSLSLKVAV
jgi:hypothetical protein